jgi:hypothetical protein
MAGMMTDMLDTMIATADSTPPKKDRHQGGYTNDGERITEDGFPDAWIDEDEDGVRQGCDRGGDGHGEDGKEAEAQSLDVNAPSDLG